MITDVIILAGGFGERLWPASSPSFPKQFMALNGGSSFLQESIKRSLALNIPGKIVIVTRKDIEEECVRQALELAAREDDALYEKIMNGTVVLSEPCAKHTAAAIMAGTCFIRKTVDNIKHTILVLTSDHVISPVENFAADCRKAAEAAEKGAFVCFTIPPTEPSTGYGYIKTGSSFDGLDSTFKIENFKEKPDYETARKYLESGSYFWNSGMFAFCDDFFMNEMKALTPEVFEAFIPMTEGNLPKLKKYRGISIIDTWPEMEKTYSSVPSIAVDKAVAEKTSNAAAVKTTFKWTDVGSWDVFSQICTSPVNAANADIEGSNNFIYTDQPVALCGVSDLVVVARNGKVLVMKKGCSALVREASQSLKNKD